MAAWNLLGNISYGLERMANFRSLSDMRKEGGMELLRPFFKDGMSSEFDRETKAKT